MKKLFTLFTGLLVLVAAGAFFAYLWQPAGSENKISAFNRIRQLPTEQQNDALKATGASEAAYLEYLMTFDPATGEIPTERSIEAFRMARKQAKNLKAIPGVEWFERGPNNVGGRIRAIMFDPNDPFSKKVYAGAEHGGLWYNNDITDPTSSWYTIGDFLGNLSISSLAYDPTDTQVMYAGTGVQYSTANPRGGGIWITVDGGLSWWQRSATANNPDFHFVSDLIVTGQGTLIANTSSGIMRSTDKGISWVKEIAGQYSADMEIGSDGTIYAALSPTTNHITETEIYKSTDDGQTWSMLTLPAGNSKAYRIELALASDNTTLYALGSTFLFGGQVMWLMKSVNGGSTWTNLSIPPLRACSINDLGTDFTRNQATHNLVIEVHPTDQDIVVIGGINLQRSTDGGQTFQKISEWSESNATCVPFVHADQLSMAFRPGYPNHAVFGNDGGMYYSDRVGDSNEASGALNIQMRNKDLNVTEFYAVDQQNSAGSNYMLAGAQDNGTQQFNKPGISSTTEALGGDGGFTHIDQDNSNIQVLSYVFSDFFASQDGGKNFLQISDDDNRGRFINPTDYDDETNILYAGGFSGEYQYSDPLDQPLYQGLNVVSTSMEGMISAIEVSPHTPNRIFAVTSRHNSDKPVVYRIDNANTSTPTVTDISGNAPFASMTYASSLSVGASDNQLLLTLSNYGIVSVYESRDGGATWINREGNLPDMPIRWGMYNPNNYNQVMLATQVGVWSTDNINTSSPDWGVTNANLANVRCNMLQYRESDGYVAVATYGRGVFTSNVWSFQNVTDIAGHWAENEINYMLRHNFLAGYSDGTFRPDNELTRAEFATMIANIINPDISSDPVIAGRTFTDITGHWAEQNILQAARSGYLAGYGDGTFRPNDKITKLQITIAIANGLPVSGGGTYLLSDFYDETSIPTWARQSVSNAYVNRLIANYPNTSYFTPNTNGTRAMAVVLLYQALANLDRTSYSTNPYIVVPAGYRLAENQPDESNEVMVYPNPAEEYIEINANINKGKRIAYEIINTQGKRVSAGYYTEGGRIDLSTMTSGQYIIMIQSDDKVFSKKLIKK
ncbi:S-layer homology domain-containing protein [Roseivirga sp. BDSF3-8]|uniref:S-layer homology domain-containing protein n=1 Tax=Roseivirga sp. BDSF3-8 TaxID=3241598 RepID=UPI0035325495